MTKKLEINDQVTFYYHEQAFKHFTGTVVEVVTDMYGSTTYWVKLNSNLSFDEVDPAINGKGRNSDKEWMFSSVHLKKISDWDE